MIMNVKIEIKNLYPCEGIEGYKEYDLRLNLSIEGASLTELAGMQNVKEMALGAILLSYPSISEDEREALRQTLQLRKPR